jgi:Ca-activated chloride channel homolog
VTQTYISKASRPTEVKYVFKLPPDASVHAFEAVIDDTRIINGVSKEKKRARAEYEQAKRQGRAAAFLEQNTVEGTLRLIN